MKVQIIHPCLDELSITADRIARAQARLLEALPNTNADQDKCMDEIFNPHGAMLYIIGFPGSGKSTTLARIICMLHELEDTKIQVMCGAPTHTATDALFLRIQEAFKAMGFENEPLRAYTGVTETKAFWEENREERTNVEREEDNESNAGIVDADDTGANTDALLDQTSVDMIYLINAYKDRVFRSKRNLSEFSVEAKAVRMAMENTETLTMSYPAGRPSRGSAFVYSNEGRKEAIDESEDEDDESVGLRKHEKTKNL